VHRPRAREGEGLVQTGPEYFSAFFGLLGIFLRGGRGGEGVGEGGGFFRGFVNFFWGEKRLFAVHGERWGRTKARLVDVLHASIVLVFENGNLVVTSGVFLFLIIVVDGEAELYEPVDP